MRGSCFWSPSRATVAIIWTALAGLALYGPIPQPANYHDFADQTTVWHIPHAADVLSNVGFAVVGAWGLLRLWPHRGSHAFESAWPGYSLFLVSLGLTALGSTFYHLAPDNTRLVWDRLPIALASAGLLAAVHAETLGGRNAFGITTVLAAAALFSVWWWRMTDLHGAGDLRPYLLMQGFPLLLVPLWQRWACRPLSERRAFLTAILLYVAAKLAELGDHHVLAWSGVMSGHTLKHVLASLASGAVVWGLDRRVACASNAAQQIAAPGERSSFRTGPAGTEPRGRIPVA